MAARRTKTEEVKKVETVTMEELDNTTEAVAVVDIKEVEAGSKLGNLCHKVGNYFDNKKAQKDSEEEKPKGKLIKKVAIGAGAVVAGIAAVALLSNKDSDDNSDEVSEDFDDDEIDVDYEEVEESEVTEEDSEVVVQEF